MADWKEKIVLGNGEELRRVGSKSTGFMGETDVDTYDVVDGQGATVGSVIVEDHTAVRGFKRTISVVQRDAAGALIFSESWTA
ncbi:hypothetical protein [Brevundimonas sp.]|uniref:hypothetical protein n=1 Tax=Brevundimonas sp. TaxID=1871086 RepID=UPI002FC9A3FB